MKASLNSRLFLPTKCEIIGSGRRPATTMKDASSCEELSLKCIASVHFLTSAATRLGVVMIIDLKLGSHVAATSGPFAIVDEHGLRALFHCECNVHCKLHTSKLLRFRLHRRRHRWRSWRRRHRWRSWRRRSHWNSWRRRSRWSSWRRRFLRGHSRSHSTNRLRNSRVG